MILRWPRDRLAARPRLVVSSLIPTTIAECFAFHLDTRNAALISPAGTRVVRIVGSFPITQGDHIELHVRQRPIPFRQRWRMEIEVVLAPTLIVDRMLSGPFRSWCHEHRFREVGDVVELTDIVHYALPFGSLGRIVDRLVVRRLLLAAFAERHRRTRVRLGATTAPGARPLPSVGEGPA